METWPDEPAERWKTFSARLRLEYEQWEALADEVEPREPDAARYMVEVQATPRLDLIPLVEEMSQHAGLRLLYPFTTHHQLRLGTRPPATEGCRYSMFWADHVGGGRFRVRRLCAEQLPKCEFEVIGEGTAAEMAFVIAREVAREAL